ncbi:AzlD domain-containing protein [Spiribacter sp. 1M153]|uniref:AzlD domain-containing protein n=1 Tax=Spiribacter roseus TaxID=1855875 RepID=UPI00349F6DE4
MVDPLWWMVAAIGVGTFIWRGAFLVFGHGLQMPDLVRRGLSYVPPAVFAALVLPGLVQWQGDGSVDAPRLLAGLVAGGVAWKTRATLPTLILGMIALWSLRALLSA